MNRLLLSLIFCVIILCTGCSKARNHCYRCIDLQQVDQAFDVCNTDTSAAGRNAYATLAAGRHVNDSNGIADSCQGYDR